MWVGAVNSLDSGPHVKSNFRGRPLALQGEMFGFPTIWGWKRLDFQLTLANLPIQTLLNRGCAPIFWNRDSSRGSYARTLTDM